VPLPLDLAPNPPFSFSVKLLPPSCRPKVFPVFLWYHFLASFFSSRHNPSRLFFQADGTYGSAEMCSCDVADLLVIAFFQPDSGHLQSSLFALICERLIFRVLYCSTRVPATIRAPSFPPRKFLPLFGLPELKGSDSCTFTVSGPSSFPPIRPNFKVFPSYRWLTIFPRHPRSR